MAMLVPPLSVAVGASKVQAVPSWTVLLVLLQLMTGAVVSMTLTVWLHWALLPQASVAAQVRVASKVLPQCPAVLVTVLTIVMTMLVPPLSVAVGASKLQAAPSCTVLLVLLQLMTGAVVSTTLTVWPHWALLPQASVAAQVRVASKVLPQCPAVLVTVLTTAMAMLVPPLSVAVGASKLQAVPIWTVLLVLLQLMTGAVVSTTLTVWLHWALLPQASVAAQVRVASKVLPQ